MTITRPVVDLEGSDRHHGPATPRPRRGRSPAPRGGRPAKTGDNLVYQTEKAAAGAGRQGRGDEKESLETRVPSSRKRWPGPISKRSVRPSDLVSPLPGPSPRSYTAAAPRTPANTTPPSKGHPAPTRRRRRRRGCRRRGREVNRRKANADGRPGIPSAAPVTEDPGSTSIPVL